MKILASTGREDVAMVYMAEIEQGKLVEFVESVQPPLPREKKWVLIVSTLFGCPVKCLMCDAGSHYEGKLSREDIFAQIDFLVKKRFPNGSIPVDKFKIQFARMGEPSLNLNTLDVLEELPHRYNATGLIPSISTIAPTGTDRFFNRLIEIKNNNYSRGRFQLQFSIHTTDERLRDHIVPAKKWNFARLAEYGEEFYDKDDRKITLNFALAEETPVDPGILLRHFDPGKFLIKITPLNPTHQAVKNRLSSYIDPYHKEKDNQIVRELRASGYEVIVSIGEVEENHIGSNCGQYVTRHLKAKEHIKNGYTYTAQKYS
ncbi:MAG: radical SAM protein [Syntrophaceae bacterium CG2_30_49_12]|nr:MAG: radical SAM protein [Syntrophaceae bacterium CG2_30_49_12]PIP05857.1 MAG: radical SAM protein [Syntrophobacterales bacterium CG23_combo_of_CG06-09_8_20_14_all_48_27]PJA48655.1 MAG: radical SAM protein [Syntrophobacterales bacterium CG_4_9_14_3_um_filter_49_8]PJC73220.1 MAG: radical SAM protein [Syntrophobacterales bacterium CG_4_8_14_3_um_filter_49_14]